MTNFDFLTEEKRFDSFSSVAVSAEKIFKIDIGACVINCRRAMEFAVKWMYSVDSELKLPIYDDSLNTLNVGFPGSVSTSVRMGNLNTKCNFLAADFTFCHVSAPPLIVDSHTIIAEKVS